MPKATDPTSKSLSHSVFSGLFWKFSERALAQIVSFIISIILARILLPEDYGIVAIVLIFISFADVFVNSGLSTALIQKKRANATDFSSIFYCSLVISIILYIIMFFCAPLLANFYQMPLLTAVTRVFALRLPLSAYNSIQHAYVSRHMLFKKFFFSTLFGTLLSGVVGIILAYCGAGVWALVAQYLTNSVVDSIVLSFTINWHPQLTFSWSSTKKLFSYGWKVFVVDFGGNFFYQLKSLVIGKAYSSTDLAYYNRGNNLVNIVTENVRTSVMAVLFPAISNVEDDRTRVKKVTRRSVQAMAYIIFPAAVGFFVVAEPLVITLLTEKWLPAVFFLRITAITALIEMIGHISIQCLKAIDRTDLILILDIANKPLFIILLIIGVQSNIETLCLLLLLSSAFGTFLNLYGCHKSINYKFSEIAADLIGPLLASATMGGLISLFGLLPLPPLVTLIIEGITGVALYLVISIIFKLKAYIYFRNLLRSRRHPATLKPDPASDLTTTKITSSPKLSDSTPTAQIASAPRRLKIALISVCGLPVPAVMGGAIETLETLIADENEVQHQLDLTIYSAAPPTAATAKLLTTATSRYHHTAFIHVPKPSSAHQTLRRLLCKIPNHFGAHFVLQDKYYNTILKDCQEKDFDYLVFEEAEYNAIIQFARVFGRDKLYLHLHSYQPYAPLLSPYLRGTIAVSDYINRTWLAEKAAAGVSDHQVHLTLTNAIDESLFNKPISAVTRRKIRASYGIKSNDLMILYVGRIIDLKGVRELAEVVSTIDHPHLKLVIVGSPNFADATSSANQTSDPYYATIADLAAAHPDRIKLAGYIKNSELYQISQAADIRCLPSKGEEAIGLALIEALYSGTPLIITNSGGMPDAAPKDGAIIINKDHRLKPELEAALLKLVSSPKLRRTMKKANLAASKQFTKHNYYQNFVNIFNKESHD